MCHPNGHPWSRRGQTKTTSKWGEVYCRDLINDLNQKIERAHEQEQACAQNETEVCAAQKNVADALSSLENLCAVESQVLKVRVVSRTIYATYSDLKSADTYSDLKSADSRKIGRISQGKREKMHNSIEKACELYQSLWQNEESAVNAIRKMPERTDREMRAKVQSAMQLLRTKARHLLAKTDDLCTQVDPAMKIKKANELKKAFYTLAQQMVQKWNNGAFKGAFQAKLERENLEEQRDALEKIRDERANWTAIQAHDETEKVCEQMNGEMLQLQRQNLSLKKWAEWMKTGCAYTIREEKCSQHVDNVRAQCTECDLLCAQEEKKREMLEAQKKAAHMSIQEAEKEIDLMKKQIQECDELVRQIKSLDQLITSNVTLLRQQRTRNLTSEEVEELNKINNKIFM